LASQHDNEHNERKKEMNQLHIDEINAIKSMPLSKATAKLADELRTLHQERDSVNPAIDKIMAAVDTMDTDKATEAITPLKVKQEIITAKMRGKRQAVMDSIIADSAKWQDQSEAAVEAARVAAVDAKATFSEKVKAAFQTKDSQRLLRGQSATQSAEVQSAYAEIREADRVAGMASAARRCLDRAYMVAKVEGGLALSGGRDYVQPVQWYWTNASLIVPALIDS